MRGRSPSFCVVVAGLVTAVVAACGSGDSTTESSTTPSPTAAPSAPPAATPAPTPPPIAAPLVVQVENSPDARPQSGLGAADIVYEYETEGGISRFSTIFFSAPPASVRVGPIRSAREATVKITKIW